MKIISCRVEGFGAIVGKEFEFDKGLTAFCLDNGAGKTTLAAFIKAMFYGLASGRANSKDVGERAKYNPFSGARFGGSLVFEQGGKRYRVERFFDSKSSARDEFKLYCGNEPCDDFGAELGKAVFGLDGDDFTRVLSVSADDIDVGSAGDAAARLNSFLGDGDDFERAVKILIAERKRYRADRGNGGKINEQKELISKIRADICAAQAKIDLLDGLYFKRKELAARKAELDKEYKKATTAEADEARRSAYEKYLAAERDAFERAAAIRKRYTELPSAEEAERVKESLAVVRVTERNAAVGLAEEKKKRLEELEARFSPMPDIKEVEECVRRESAKGGQDGATANQTVARSANGKQKNKNLPLVLLAVLSALCLVGGVITLFYYVAVGAALCAVGALGLAALAFLYLKNKINAVEGSRVATIAGLDKDTVALLARYGYAAGLYELGVMHSELLELDALRREYAEVESKRNEQNDKLTAEYARINAFLQKCGVDAHGDYEGALAEIIAAAGEVDGLEKSAASYKALAANYAAEHAILPDCDGCRTVDEVCAEQDLIVRELIETDKLIGECEDYAIRKEGMDAALAFAEGRREAYEKNYSVVAAALSALKSADETLKERYVGPVRERFLKYLLRVDFAFDGGVELDKHFRILNERGGALRGEEYLSMGEKSVSALCFRLALADEIFEGDAPVLILDDPFVHLDERRLKPCLKALRELAAERQILYFTCHPSRKI